MGEKQHFSTKGAKKTGFPQKMKIGSVPLTARARTHAHVCAPTHTFQDGLRTLSSKL